MDFVDEPLVWDQMGPIQYIKHSFGALISKLCSKLKSHVSNKDIHVTAEYKAKLDDLIAKVDELSTKVADMDTTTEGGTASAVSQVLNNEDLILHVVDKAGYIKEIPTCYVTKEELPFLIVQS